MKYFIDKHVYFFPCIFLCVHDDCTFISVGTNERPGEAIWIVSLAVSKVSNGLTLCSVFWCVLSLLIRFWSVRIAACMKWDVPTHFNTFRKPFYLVYDHDKISLIHHQLTFYLYYIKKRSKPTTGTCEISNIRNIFLKY